MYWKISELDPAQRRTLADISQNRGWLHESEVVLAFHGQGLWYFFSRRHQRWLLFCVLLGLAINGLIVWLINSTMDEVGLDSVLFVGLLWALPLIWTLLVVCEWLRDLRSSSKPFLLLTSRVLFKADYDHGELEGYYLRDATAFHSEEKHNREQYIGREYSFTFGQDNVIFRVSPGYVSTVEEILEKARSGEATAHDTAEILPVSGGSLRRTTWREFTNPFGAFWLLVAVLLILAFVVLAILAKIFRW